MNWKEFYNNAVNGIVFADGAMGTLLQEVGLTGEDCPEEWNISHRDDILRIQKAYVEVGAQMLTTNTLGGNRVKLKNYNMQDRVVELNTVGVEIAKEAAGDLAIVAASVGPTGKFIVPLGEITFDEMMEIYMEQIKALAEAGADVIDFETHVDILELKAGILAAREVCDLPIIANLTFGADGRTVTGTTPEAGFTTLEALGVDIIGTNCSTGPDIMAKIIERVRPLFSIPIIAQANAGVPHIHNGKTVFDEEPEEYSEKAGAMISMGVNVIGGCCGTTDEYIGLMVNVIGGCCGTTPEHIKTLRDKVEVIKPKLYRENKEPNYLKLSSRFEMKIMGFDKPFTVIGERLNPTARKKLSKDIMDGEYLLFKEEALRQQEAGADILDMNMGIPNSNEPELVKKGIEILSTSIDLPIAIDSANIEAARIGMKLYPGKPILNSISAESERLALLPDVKKYGAAFIALPIDENGIPKTADERIAILQKIIDEATKLGIDKKNIIADPLVLTVSAQQEGAKVTLETIRRATEELGIFTTCGLSNISFGLPLRGYINRNFLSMAIANGLTSAIVNPMDEQIMGEIRASDVLLAKDQNSGKYIKLFANKKEIKVKLSGVDKDTTNKKVEKATLNLSVEQKMADAVLNGSKNAILPYVEEALNNGLSAVDILNNHLIPAITEVGDLYDKRIYFLPQLMMSAETMKNAFKRLEPLLKSSGSKSKGKIVIATVKGDVHDIGKNIVVIMLQNFGFEIYDLGKDVPKEAILDKAIEVGADIIGLSALMTTTMPAMQELMNLVKEKSLDYKVMVGGAAVTRKFAEEIGAHYATDAVSAVKLAEQLVNS